MRTSALLAAACLLLPGAAAAQRGWDVQGHAMALLRDSSWVGGGAGAGLRVGRGLRLAATAGMGWAAPDRVGGRGELLVAYHLYPPRREGAGVYAGAGAALEVTGGDARGLMLAVLGVELRPWLGGGLFGEVGVGGGARVAVGYRAIRLARRR